jgi:AcrR family transcriptional regulator
MNISPGNLYYHFKNKDDIINCIFQQFEREIDKLLALPSDRAPNVEDAWLFLHVLFELIWKYRFFYRDLNNLLANNRTLELKFTAADAEGQGCARAMRWTGQGREQASARDRGACDQQVVVATYWLSYSTCWIRATSTNRIVGAALQRGCYQVMALTPVSDRAVARCSNSSRANTCRH